ncbi:MAG: translation elongation factor Ts [Candidatus Eisenbacteria bacterium]|nr:translation elongation factor Ts [Candidatus Eisenbacteria bacterium]
MTISAERVKELRERTGAGMMECKKALVEASGDMEKAVEHLRKIGAAVAAKKEGRATKDGLIFSYIHPGGRLGVLVEVNCETDFVARTADFQTFVKDIAMHIAASSPIAVRREDVPAEVIAKETEIYQAQAAASGKPPAVCAKMVEGRIEKFFEEQVLLEQPFIRDPKTKVRDLVTAMIAKVGENIGVRRFARFGLGEG